MIVRLLLDLPIYHVLVTDVLHREDLAGEKFLHVS